MCYSAMVQQDAQKLGLKFSARIQYDSYLDLFSRRLSGEKLVINRAMESQFIKNPKTPEAKKICRLITEWHEEQIAELEAEIFKQKERLANAERTLKTKTTKKAQEDVRIATKKIEKCKADLKKHKSTEIKSEGDERIFPFHQVSVVMVDDEGERIVRPARYHMRPHDKDESFDRDYGGCYNARFDNLKRVAFWKDSLAKRRGVMMIKRFYENVPIERYLENHKLPKDKQDRSNLVICFEPDDTEMMIIPVIWDVWKKRGESPLYSAALITDDPAPEIREVGHDRTPIFLKESAVNDWLHAESIEKAIQALGQRETPYYSHRLMIAA